MRLAKYLALTGCCSRRAATRLIRDGHVMIDSRLANHIDTVTLLETPDGLRCQEQLLVNGKLIAAVEAKAYWLFNKAVGTDSRLLADLPNSLWHLLPESPRLYPVGRLDKDSRGLLMLTNDGELAHQLMHPDFGHCKTYHVTVDRHFSDEFLLQMAAGVSYKDVTTLPCNMSRLTDDSYQIVLTQGLNRQIRRMSQALGYKVIDLKRISIQSLTLADLAEGEMRQLTEAELSQLKASLAK
ncbi:23S rRNA pseudouridine synthase F [Shewanella sp. Choline-02u-19]|uniref:RNA pseudouridine synthase n=1 Tax=unclassified Shewanella TaxID=196818 RepID=UPI000C335314|nr:MULTISPECIES: RNA pseudouridine synthase [unclassified Shewanella]PKH55574.1 23S rRNA pseudouridine synthase F [Shewanella sp. Bg11-22]PKI29952.1 23S rRNA pseudouridine synthase F [Shewanella sp. Choline-02u-19]